MMSRHSNEISITWLKEQRAIIFFSVVRGEKRTKT